jgi:hypothetical protein
MCLFVVVQHLPALFCVKQADVLWSRRLLPRLSGVMISPFSLLAVVSTPHRFTNIPPKIATKPLSCTLQLDIVMLPTF